MARKYAAGCARLEASAPERQRRFYTLLVEQLPQHEAVLIGRDRILDFLCRTLQLRRPGGGEISWRMVQRWARDCGFPLLRGAWRPRHRTPPMTTSFLVSAWVVSRVDTDQRALFRVGKPTAT